ncbi:tetratricopeptide repeat protein [Puniceicoccus vermicola]
MNRYLLLSFAAVASIVSLLVACAEGSSAEPNPITVFEIQEMTDGILSLMREKEYEEVQAIISPYKEERLNTRDGFSAYDLFVFTLASRREMGALLEHWIAANPKTSIPYTLYGEWATKEAWRFRGGSWASQVTDDGWDGFETYLQKAKDRLLMAYKIDPTDYVACSEMITVSMGLSDREGVDLWFDRAVSIDPLYFSPYAKKAYALYPRWLGSSWEVFSFIQEYAGLDPRFGQIESAWYEADFEEEVEDPNSEKGKRCQQIIEEYRKEYPDSALAMRLQAELYWLQGMQSEALEWAKMAAEQDPRSQNLYRYSLYLYKTNRDRKALELAERAFELNPDNEDISTLIGRINHYGFGNYREAIDAYSRAIDLKNGLRVTTRKRADCYYYIGEYEKAVADYQASINYRPDYAKAHRGLGCAYYRMGNILDAQRAFSTAMYFDPSESEEISQFLDQFGNL